MAAGQREYRHVWSRPANYQFKYSTIAPPTPARPRRKRPHTIRDRHDVRVPKTAPLVLAKISPPVLATVYERERLYHALDEAGRRPLTWLTAPAGAGKTTLAASYLKARNRPALWLELEADNADPASFVYYLRLAAQRLAPRRAATLPLLTPQYQLGLPAFAKHLFETLGTTLSADTILVLDNYQEVGDDAALHAFLAEGLTTLPPGMRLICLSRQTHTRRWRAGAPKRPWRWSIGTCCASPPRKPRRL